jgi:hypothetical protein
MTSSRLAEKGEHQGGRVESGVLFLQEGWALIIGWSTLSRGRRFRFAYQSIDDPALAMVLTVQYAAAGL